MPLVPMRPLLDYAREHTFGFAAFNDNNMEQIQGILLAALEIQAPVIIQASRGAREYTDDAFLRHLMLLEDDSKTPSSYEYNVAVTRHVVDVAHAVGVSVEGELGTIGSIERLSAGEQEDSHGAVGKLTMEQLLTDPDQAVDFVKQTGVDALAIAIGTSHGAYKFTKEPTSNVLVIDRILEIHERIPDCHLVMHGSSSVPQDLLKTINCHGGSIRQTWGVPVSEIQRAIKAGVRKVNVDTDIRLAITAAIRTYFTEHPEGFDPRGYLKEARQAVKRVCRERMEQFGQTGHGPKIPHITCEEMAKQYHSGVYGESAKPRNIGTA
jgi:fructose-bisphosphate aldolase class II